MKKIKSTYGEHVSQFGELHIPETSGPWPVIVSIHGGFWKSKYQLDESNDLAVDLSKRGYAVWNIEYRRVGEIGGGWPGTFLDIIAAVNHLTQLKSLYDLELTKGITLIGHSAGGHLALWASSNDKFTDETIELKVPIEKVISLAEVTDLEHMLLIHNSQKPLTSPVLDFIGGTVEAFQERYNKASPANLLPLRTPQVLIHGMEDRHVPIELSTDYYNKAKAMGDEIEIVKLSGIEHFGVVDPASSAWKSVLQYL